MAEQTDIGVIIVCFNPSKDDILNISTVAQKYKGVIVDNSDCANFNNSNVGNMYYMPLNSNKGIAEAQNKGIALLLQDKEIEYIVFLDQDSRLETTYPEIIVTEFKKAKQSRLNLALLGPTVDNITTGEEYHSVIHKDTKESDGFVPRRDVISSGSVTSRMVIEDIGLNDASLFIDFVDFEWCWRAETKGYICGITHNVHICHQVGKRELSFGAYKVIASAPARYYYQYRNHLWLCRRRYVPTQWKIATAIKHLARLVYFPLFVKEGLNCWRYMWKGIIASINSPQNNIPCVR